MKPMRHKGYPARIEYSDEDGCFIGRVAGIRDIITFHGNSVSEVREAFEEAVEFYQYGRFRNFPAGSPTMLPS